MAPELCARRALVTGAAGFIGANLTRALVAAGAEVHAVTRPTTDLWRLVGVESSVTLHRADVTDRAAIEALAGMVRPNVVFHLAAPGGHPMTAAGRRDVLRTCVQGTINLLEAVSSCDIQRFVHLGSSLEYEPRPRPLRESDALQPVTIRGVAKAAASILVRQFARAGGPPSVVLVPFSVYGPWEGPGRLVPTAIRAALDGSTMALTQPGSRHDLVFVEDVVEACLLAACEKTASGRTFNIGSGQEWTNEEVVEAVGRVVGRKITVEVGAYRASPSDTSHWVADISRAGRLLRWQPRHTLHDGLARTITWVRDAAPAALRPSVLAGRAP